MHYEIERKYRLLDPQRLRERLSANDAELLSREAESNFILDTPTRTLLAAGCGLRVRETTDLDTGARRATLCYKGRATAGLTKSRCEVETGVDAARSAELLRIFELLDHAAVIRFEKRRTTWRLKLENGVGVIVTVDELPVAGFFCEIEAETESAILAAAAQLELDDADVETNTYVAIAAKLGLRTSATGRIELAFDA